MPEDRNQFSDDDFRRAYEQSNENQQPATPVKIQSADGVPTFVIPAGAPTIENTSPVFGKRFLPWETIGQPVLKNRRDVYAALEEVGLNWTVEQKPVYVEGKVVPWKLANVRSDTRDVLDFVGLDYKVYQNKQVFEIMQNLMQDSNMQIDNVLIFGGGKHVAIVAKTNPFTVLGDRIEPYFLMDNSFDGNRKLQFALTMIRAVCLNTLTMAQTAKRIWGIKHVRSIDDRITEAARSLGLMNDYMTEFPVMAEFMADVNLSVKEEARIAGALFPVTATMSKKAEQKAISHQAALLQAIHETPDLKQHEGTGWAFYNALADKIQHEKPAIKRKDTRTQWENRVIDTVDGNELLNRAQAMILQIGRNPATA
jgi:phage/plasmid-like protein (TIGR03299 family)